MTALSRQSKIVYFLGLAALTACVAYPQDGYYRGYNAYYGDNWPGYYEPYGFYYNSWAPNYYVAPYREHEFEERREEFREHHWNNSAPAHAFRAAPASRPVPSIPSRAAVSGGHWHSGRRDSH